MSHHLLSTLSLAVALAACGSGTAAAPAETMPVEAPPPASGLSFSQAIDLAAQAHPTATAFAVERETTEARVMFSVKLLEGQTIHIVQISADDRSITSDASRAVPEARSAEFAMLATSLAAQEAPLHHALDLMVAMYGDASLGEVELEMHGSEVILEAAVLEGETRSVRVHDAMDGHYMMTESD